MATKSPGQRAMTVVIAIVLIVFVLGTLLEPVLLTQ
jgi:hypothetical protein